MSFEAPAEPKIAQAPPPPPMYGEKTAGAKKKPKSMQTTYLGMDSIPDQTQLGQKTLLGQ